jgi:hypothetical protein
MHDPYAPVDQQAQKLADYMTETGLELIELSPEYYYASLPLCIIDAVFSIGVTYTSTRNTVIRFCERQGWTRTLEPKTERNRGEHTIGEFLGLFEGLTQDQMADDLFGNRQRTSSRSGIPKAEAVRRFAEALRKVGIDDFVDLASDRLAAAENLVREIPGQKSGISFDYFQMLAGDDNLIKPDRMVQRYIGKAIDLKPEQVTPDRARELLIGAIKILEAKGTVWSPRQLDYTIWKMQSEA